MYVVCTCADIGDRMYVLPIALFICGRKKNFIKRNCDKNCLSYFSTMITFFFSNVGKNR